MVSIGELVPPLFVIIGRLRGKKDLHCLAAGFEPTTVILFVAP